MLKDETSIPTPVIQWRACVESRKESKRLHVALCLDRAFPISCRGRFESVIAHPASLPSDSCSDGLPRGARIDTDAEYGREGTE